MLFSFLWKWNGIINSNEEFPIYSGQFGKGVFRIIFFIFSVFTPFKSLEYLQSTSRHPSILIWEPLDNGTETYIIGEVSLHLDLFYGMHVRHAIHPSQFCMHIIYLSLLNHMMRAVPELQLAVR